MTALVLEIRGIGRRLSPEFGVVIDRLDVARGEAVVLDAASGTGVRFWASSRERSRAIPAWARGCAASPGRASGRSRAPARWVSSCRPAPS